MKYLFSILIIILFPLSLWASAGAESGAIPYGFIKLQAINFAVFLVLIVVIIKLKINPALANKSNEYIAKANEAAKKLEESKNERDSLKRKISDLDKDYEKNISEARKQANLNYDLQISNAKEVALRIDKDLDRQVSTLKQVYWSRLKENLFASSVEELKKDLDESVDVKAFEQLQKSFVDRMDVRL